MLTNPIISAVDKVYCLVFIPQYFGRKLYNSLVHGCTNINMHEKLDLHAIFSVFTKHVLGTCKNECSGTKINNAREVVCYIMW